MTKPHLEPRGLNPVRPGQAAGSESCVAAGNRVLRSVDRQRAGRVIEPRKRLNVVAARRARLRSRSRSRGS